MAEIDYNEERLKQTKMGIRWQVVAEDLHRDDLEKLAILKEFLKIECADDEISDIFLTWANSLIEENFKMRMQTKKMMKDGINDAIEINMLRSGYEAA